jgi:hypothetical protein
VDGDHETGLRAACSVVPAPKLASFADGAFKRGEPVKRYKNAAVVLRIVGFNDDPCGRGIRVWCMSVNSDGSGRCRFWRMRTRKC